MQFLRTKEVALKFSESSVWLRRQKQRKGETGELAPQRGKPGPKPTLQDHLTDLEKLIEDSPDATLEELRQKRSVVVSIAMICRALKTLGIAVKNRCPFGWARS